MPNLIRSILEYYTIEEAERAVRELDGRELRGHTVSLRLQDSVRLFPIQLRYTDLTVLQRSRGGRNGYEVTYRREGYRRYSRSRSRSRSPRRYDERERERYDDRERDYRRRLSPRRYDERRDYGSR